MHIQERIDAEKIIPELTTKREKEKRIDQKKEINHEG